MIKENDETYKSIEQKLKKLDRKELEKITLEAIIKYANLSESEFSTIDNEDESITCANSFFEK